jgi:acetyl esterase/lipase
MRYIFFLLTMSFPFFMHGQSFMPLWPDGKVPYNLPHKPKEQYELTNDSLKIVRNVTIPGMTVFLAPKNLNTGMAVVICPGGAYTVEAYDHEGIQVAQQLNEWGINAVVLKYRLPNDSTMTNKKWVPLIDALQAIKLVRSNAVEWGIKTNKVGIMGFSAGGHLAATVSTHFDQRQQDGFKPEEVRPDFSILCYAVITMKEEYTHSWSKFMLLGHYPSYQDVLEFSNETKVTPKTPPTFLIHTADDFVAVENSMNYAAALIRNKVPVTCHILPSGGHGYGLAKGKKGVDVWVGYWKEWLNNLQ